MVGLTTVQGSFHSPAHVGASLALWPWSHHWKSSLLADMAGAKREKRWVSVKCDTCNELSVLDFESFKSIRTAVLANAPCGFGRVGGGVLDATLMISNSPDPLVASFLGGNGGGAADV